MSRLSKWHNKTTASFADVSVLNRQTNNEKKKKAHDKKITHNSQNSLQA